jgi:hypothetical protein
VLNATAYSNELTQTLLDFDLWPLDLRVSDLGYVFHELREYHVPIMQADILPTPETDVGVDGDLMYHLRSLRNSLPKSPAKAVKPPTKLELVLIVERIEDFCIGLCLDCLNGNKTCRVQHTDPFSEDLWSLLRHVSSDGGPDYGADTKRPVDWEGIW